MRVSITLKSLGATLIAALFVAAAARADKPVVSSLAGVKGVCGELLTADEIASLGKPRPPFAMLDAAEACGVDSQKRTGFVPDYGIYASARGAAMQRRDLAPGGMFSKAKVKPLKDGCGIEAWSVETPGAYLLIFVQGEAGGNVRFGKAAFKNSAVAEKACKLLAPRIGLLDKLTR
jgi:hypothetical protein